MRQCHLPGGLQHIDMLPRPVCCLCYLQYCWSETTGYIDHWFSRFDEINALCVDHHLDKKLLSKVKISLKI